MPKYFANGDIGSIKLGSWEIVEGSLRPLRCLLQEHVSRLAQQTSTETLASFRVPNANDVIAIPLSRIEEVSAPLSTLACGDFRESSASEITLHGEDYETFSLVRDFFYLHPIDMTRAPLRLVYVADRWQLDTLFKACLAWAETIRVPHWNFLLQWIPLMLQIHVPSRFKELVAMKFAASVAEEENSFEWLMGCGYSGSMAALDSLVNYNHFPRIECHCEKCTSCECSQCPLFSKRNLSRKRSRSEMLNNCLPTENLDLCEDKYHKVFLYRRFTTNCISASQGERSPHTNLRKVMFRHVPYLPRSCSEFKRRRSLDNASVNPTATRKRCSPKQNSPECCIHRLCTWDAMREKSVWKAFHFQKMLPLVFRYLQQFAAQEPTALLADVVCKQLAEDLTDDEMKDLLARIRFSVDSGNIIDKFKLKEMWSGRAQCAYEDAFANSTTALYYQTLPCFVWKVENLKQKALNPVDSISVRSYPVLWNGAEFIMKLHCEDTYSMEGASLDLTFKQEGLNTFPENMYDMEIRGSQWFIENGCRCELRKDYKTSAKDGGSGLNMVFGKQCFKRLQEPGFTFTVMERKTFKSWLKHHTKYCSLLISVQLKCYCSGNRSPQRDVRARRDINSLNDSSDEETMNQDPSNNRTTNHCYECDEDVYDSDYRWYSDEEEGKNDSYDEYDGRDDWEWDDQSTASS